jgi:HD-GYP domain-containing protein (c-di-GMP phosphodiesterase class II)
MTSDRSYRRGPGRMKALTELRRNSGSQFDPDLVAAFIGKIENLPDA